MYDHVAVKSFFMELAMTMCAIDFLSEKRKVTRRLKSKLKEVTSCTDEIERCVDLF